MEGSSVPNATAAGEARQRDVAVPRPVPTVPRRLRRYLALQDFEAAARRRLPRQIYGYYSGAAETGGALRENLAAYGRLSLLPRVLVGVGERTTRSALFGVDYAMPVGIGPMGLSGLSTFEGDLVLAKAAGAEGVPMVVSATSLIPLERLAREGGARWFQCYVPGDADRIVAMMERVARAGYDTVVLTADVPVAANRENNERNGFSIPLEPSLQLVWQGLSHPRWSLGTFARTLLRGMPHFENMDAFRGPAMLSAKAVRDIGPRDALSWRHLEVMRRHWPGRLVVKGLLDPGDVALARECGADGVWVSNHGGRQLDTAVSPAHVLPAIRAAAGGMVVLVDSGVRRGTDVLKALALGADFVFVGRPFLYAAAVAGEEGVRHALRLMRSEIDRDMALMGINRLSELGTDRVMTPPGR